MMRIAMLLLAALAGLVAQPALATTEEDPMLIIAHRGASGERPEHTLAAYERAIDLGADYVEPDLVATRDLVLVARHENEIGGTTDVAEREAFADRRRTKTIDGETVTGWFAEDFTLAELRTLRASERLPAIRPANTAFDGLYQIPTFAEIVALVRAKEAETGRRIGIYPELKHPDFLLQEAGIDMVDLMVAALAEAGYTAEDDPIFVQCFEIGPLRRLDSRTDVPLVQLIAARGGPADEPSMRYAAMVGAAGLADIATYADAVGVELSLALEEDGTPSPLVTLAHAEELQVHVWTLRAENAFLPAQLKRGDGADASRGDMEALYRALARTGVDGVFTDHVAEAVAARADRM